MENTIGTSSREFRWDHFRLDFSDYIVLITFEIDKVFLRQKK